MLFFLDYYSLLLLLPGIILGIYAQVKVSSTFSKFSQVYSRSNTTASDMAGMMIERYGLHGVQVRQIMGNLTDHFDPRDGTLNLSQPVYGSTSVAALGVAAHEVGHAVQHDRGYVPLKLRSALVKVTNWGTRLAIPLVLIGVLIELIAGSAITAGMQYVAAFFIMLGVVGYGLSTVFALITLPVEFNASRRAYSMVQEIGVLDKTEAKQAKQVLNAAALTYVASFLTSLLYFLRFLLILARLRGRRD